MLNLLIASPLSQVVLLNLLIAVMSETWSNIKEHEEVEWKLLSVSSIDEFFQLHHVRPCLVSYALVSYA